MKLDPAEVATFIEVTERLRGDPVAVARMLDTALIDLLLAFVDGMDAGEPA